MVSIRLMGGLGNQMFQVACTYNLAKINNDIAVFNFDKSLGQLQGKKSFEYKNNIFSEYTHKIEIQPKNFYNEKKFSYDKIPYNHDLLLNGYFQSEKYFLENKEEIVSKFTKGLEKEYEKNSKIKKFINEINNGLPLIAVHVRRGDYLHYPDIHTLCSMEYFKNSFSLLEKKIGKFNSIIISDDKKWCKENFKNSHISPFENDIEDLLLIINSDHNIISNSTFGWWGSYLNKNKNKIIIAPSIWFGPKGHSDQQDIVPDDWIKI